jgi:hypothetical protein
MPRSHARGEVTQDHAMAVQHRSEDDHDPSIATPDRRHQPWLAVGLVFLALFLAILVWAVIRPVT